MSLTAIIILVLIGIILLLVEFFLVPGITIAGIAGILMIITSLYLAYSQIGPPKANFILIGTLVTLIIFFTFAFRANTWKRVSLNTNVEGKILDIASKGVEKGDKGKTITRLNPVGKVLIKDQVYEAKSQEGLLAPNTEIEVLKVLHTQLIVKPLQT